MLLALPKLIVGRHRTTLTKGELRFEPKRRIISTSRPSLQISEIHDICRLAADWHDGQYSASLGPQISGLTPPVLFRQEGRSRVVTNVGWDVVDARASARKCGRRAS